MKKQLFTLIVLSLSACVAVAQPTLTATNSNPVIGDAFVAVNCDTTGITAPGTGTGFVWDYSTLRATLTDTAYGLACTSTPYCSMFPGTTISTKSLNGGNYGYLIANTSKLSQNGTYYNTTDYLTFSNPMDQFRYPFTFGTGFTDTMAGLLVKSGIVFHQTGTESVTCDG